MWQGNATSAPIEKDSDIHQWQDCYKNGKQVLPKEEDMPEKRFDAARRMIRDKRKNSGE